MGNQPSAHQPLERGRKRASSFRFSRRERSSPLKKMDKIRRSFRDSFRKRKDGPEASKPHQWHADETAVRSGTCTFQVKYLGCVEVNESRGMQTCEEALKLLRMSKKKPIRAILHVSGDGLRVVEDETKGLIVDQTIEKVSFCAPDRNHEKGFSYICRDGTAKRWMCHGFLAVRESGDRLSHAVGCAFSVCLERKQRRDNECGVTMTFDHKTSVFTRTGSFRQPSLTECMQNSHERAIDVPPTRQVYNPYAIERPHATPSMLERQGSFRGFNQLNQASPFKRQLSLRVNDLPSNYERARSHSLEPTDLSRMPSTLSHQIPIKPTVSPIPEISPSGQDSVSALCQQVSRDLSLLSSDDFGSVITTTSTVVRKFDTTTTTTTTIIPGVTGSSSLDNLKLQNGTLADFTSTANNNSNNNSSGGNGGVGSSSNNNNNDNNNSSSSAGNNIEESNTLGSSSLNWQESSSSIGAPSTNHRLTPILNQCCSLSPVLPRSSVNNTPNPLPNVTASIFDTPAASPAFSTASTSSLGSSSNVSQQLLNRSPIPSVVPLSILGDSPTSSLQASSSNLPTQLTTTVSTISPPIVPSLAKIVTPMPVTQPTPDVVADSAAIQPVPSTTDLPKPDQWLGSVTTQATAAVPPVAAPRRAPQLHARAMSLGSAVMNPNSARQGPTDPFDAAWADTIAHRDVSTTNPFILPNTTQTFQVQL